MKKSKENASAPPETGELPDSSLFARYQLLVANGQITDDEAQHQVLNALEALSRDLSQLHTPQSGFGRIFKRVTAQEMPRGLYIWGNVGRGKSMLMELFFSQVPVKRKRRVHFHAFMQEVHARIHELRRITSNESGSGDPVARLARLIAEETQLLCFDELQATDVADATLLHRLFSGLFEAQVVIVSTSNHPPASLYTGNVQRERFEKFIALIEERMDVVALSSPLDYRRLQIKSLERRYVFPLGAETDRFVEETIRHLTHDPKAKRDMLVVQGRKIPFTLYNHSIARFSFAELCETPLGPADYLALAKRCDTLILTDIPKLPPEKRNEAKRFVTLIDALYERKVKLLATAEVPPEGIYTGGDGSFEFARTVSRLIEMQSKNWGEL